jgi:ribonuclease HI
MNAVSLPNIYTDGSCLKNPGGEGGWAFVVVKDNEIDSIGYGSNPSTTNNRMELFAVIQALSVVDKGEYNLYTDSQLVLKCATGIWNIKANIELWNEYNVVSQDKKINWYWVKAHNGNKYNEIVDKIAYEEAKKLQKNKKSCRLINVSST